jgi:hypothetical protein
LAPSRGQFAPCREIFPNNREAVLEILQHFNEDVTALQRAIRWGEGDKLQELSTRTRTIRRSIIKAKQADSRCGNAALQAGNMGLSALLLDQGNGLFVEGHESFAAKPAPLEGDQAIGEISAGIEHCHSGIYGRAIHRDIAGIQQGIECEGSPAVRSGKRAAASIGTHTGRAGKRRCAQPL